MKEPGLTIGRLARAADVGIETIRYYQRRNLLPVPDPDGGAFRHYPLHFVNRIRFVKRAQDLGFTLDEIASLLQLEDGANRKAIRTISNERLQEIQRKISDLQRMEQTLTHLIHTCEATGRAQHCPIIAALAGQPNASHCSS